MAGARAAASDPSTGPIRVLHVLGGAGIGGVETFVRNTCASVDRDRFDLSVCVIGAEGPLCDDLRALDVPVLSLGSPRLGPAETMGFQKWLRGVGPHVLHANVGGRRIRWLARALTGSAVIVSQWGLAH